MASRKKVIPLSNRTMPQINKLETTACAAASSSSSTQQATQMVVANTSMSLQPVIASTPPGVTSTIPSPTPSPSPLPVPSPSPSIMDTTDVPVYSISFNMPTLPSSSSSAASSSSSSSTPTTMINQANNYTIDATLPPFKNRALLQDLESLKVRVELRGEQKELILVAPMPGDKKFMYEIPYDLKSLPGASFDEINDGWRFPVADCEKVESALADIVARTRRHLHAPKESEHIKEIENFKASFLAARLGNNIRPPPTHVLAAEMIPKGNKAKNAHVKGIAEFNMDHEFQLIKNLSNRLLSFACRTMTIGDYERLKKLNIDRSRGFGIRDKAVEKADEEAVSKASKNLTELGTKINQLTEQIFGDVH